MTRSTRAVHPLLRFDGSVKHDPAIDTWLDALPSELGAIARAWVTQVRRAGPAVRELMHDGFATGCVSDAPFAYVGAFTAHVNVGFFHGVALPDPSGLLKGTGKSMRHVTLRPGADVDQGALETLIRDAYRDIVQRLGRVER